MVLPPEGERRRRNVRVIRNPAGRLVGFQDPRTGRFITKEDAIRRLRYDPGKRQIIDDFGNPAKIAELRLPVTGHRLTLQAVEQVSTPLPGDPMFYRPNPNQEIVERTVFIDKDGNLVTIDISYGYGEAYDPTKGGGKWRHDISEGLGIPESKRVPTSRLNEAVVEKYYYIKETGRIP